MTRNGAAFAILCKEYNHNYSVDGNTPNRVFRLMLGPDTYWKYEEVYDFLHYYSIDHKEEIHYVFGPDLTPRIDFEKYRISLMEKTQYWEEEEEIEKDPNAGHINESLARSPNYEVR
jgi:hypothetical protein